MVRDGPAQPAPYPADKARGGAIILRTPLRHMIYLSGLIAAAVVGLAFALWR
jgi:hypothetical protein